MSITLWKPEQNTVLHQALGKLAEETAELSKIAIRCMIQGFDAADPVTEKPNGEQLLEESADVRAAMRWFYDVIDEPYKGESPRERRKFDGFRKWQELLEADQCANVPVGAYTIDLTGCEHMSRDTTNIERIAAAGSNGSTEVIYLYAGPAPSMLLQGNESADQMATVAAPAKYLNMRNGWLCEIVTDLDGIVAFRYEGRDKLTYLGKSEFESRFQRHPQTPAPQRHAEVDPALIGIAEAVKESGGGWRPCSGCYDTEDGHPTQTYDHSPALQTDIGCGCHECGGLGAIWEYYSDQDIADMLRNEESLATMGSSADGKA